MYMTCMVGYTYSYTNTFRFRWALVDVLSVMLTWDLVRLSAVEVCLKSNSNANPAEIKALVER
jgi:hypothetical protein